MCARENGRGTVGEREWERDSRRQRKGEKKRRGGAHWAETPFVNYV